MSPRKRSVILSPGAQADYEDILIYTSQQWGPAQRDRYAAKLDKAIAGLADFPEAGQRCAQLFAGCRTRRIERHVLYYRVENDAIEVLRVLHERTDPTRHLHP
jgi:toxin ParE1/3/4